MDDKRQNIQLELALGTESKGEARRLGSRGTESFTAGHDTESLAEEQLMERVCGRENLKRALARVKSNKGSAGVDGMSVTELPTYLKVHWPQIRERLLAGQYDPPSMKLCIICRSILGAAPSGFRLRRARVKASHLCRLKRRAQARTG